jgi:ketosteroid isomerase-like protein
MSQENVETFKRSGDAFRRGDIDGWLEEFVDPEIEWHSALPQMLTQGGTVYRGHADVGAMFREIAEVLDELTLRYTEIHDVGDRVVGIDHMRTRGRESGVETDGGRSGNAHQVRPRTRAGPGMTGWMRLGS